MSAYGYYTEPSEDEIQSYYDYLLSKADNPQIREFERCDARFNLLTDAEQNKQTRIVKRGSVKFITTTPHGRTVKIHWRQFGIQLVRDFYIDGRLIARSIYS